METNNIKNYPDNIFEPYNVSGDFGNYKMYKASFLNLYALYDYLKSNPDINRYVFRQLSSVDGSESFAGKPYDEALEDLIEEYDPGYEEFLKFQGKINAKKGKVHKYKTVRTVAGGHINVPAYSVGSPLCYESEERITKPKFVKMHVTLSYHWGTSKSQVLNRAIIITNILRALEKANYNVSLNTFELSEEYRELIYIVVQIKKYGGTLDMQALYKTLCNVEFLRRILFRVLETLDVEENWSNGYGCTCNRDFTRDVLKFGKDDIYFDQPDRMGIYGRDLAEDFENAINRLNIQNKIDVEKAKREFKEGTKILRKI